MYAINPSKTVKEMTNNQLQKVINASHKTGEYDSFFKMCCRERNDREIETEYGFNPNYCK